MHKSLLPTAIAASLFALAGSANAATATTTFGVTATVLKNCSVTASALAFGNYTPTTGAVNGTTTVGVRCTKNTSFSVALDKGTTTGGSITQRLLANGANALQYNLYTDTAHTTLFGDGTTGTAPTGTGNGLGAGAAVNFTVYGQVPDSSANQDAVPGNYSDTITVTVTY